MEASESTQCTEAGGRAGAGRGCRSAHVPSSPDLTGSYLQVVVEKHKRDREPALPPRLPTASSPIRGQCQSGGGGGGCGAGDGGGAGAAWARGAVLLACPPASLAYYVGAEGTAAECGAGAAPGAGGGGRGDAARGSQKTVSQQLKNHKSWYIFREPEAYSNLHINDDVECGASAEPECVEVYRFERVGAWLASGAARPTRVERRSARSVRAARAAAAELGAAARLAVGAPLHAVLLTLRCALQLARDAAAGVVHAAADYALKPALALTFNALLHPALVFLGNLLRGAREALRPACGALSEGAAAVAVLLRAVRLVELHVTAPAPAPACACSAHPPPPAPATHVCDS